MGTEPLFARSFQCNHLRSSSSTVLMFVLVCNAVLVASATPSKSAHSSILTGPALSGEAQFWEKRTLSFAGLQLTPHYWAIGEELEP